MPGVRVRRRTVARRCVQSVHRDGGLEQLDDQIEAVDIEQLECIHRAARGRDDETHPFEQAGHEAQGDRLVIDTQDPLPIGRTGYRYAAPLPAASSSSTTTGSPVESTATMSGSRTSTVVPTPIWLWSRIEP